MKTVCLFLTATLAFTLTTNAQLMDGGFENWEDQTSPEHWDTSNEQMGPEDGVTRIEPGRTGDYCVRLRAEFENDMPNPAYVHSLFPVDEMPSMMSFYHKGNLSAGDTLFSMIAVIDDESNILAAGISIRTESNENAWTQEEMDIMSIGGGGNAAFCDVYFVLITYNENSTAEIFLDDIALDENAAPVLESSSDMQVYQSGDYLLYNLTSLPSEQGEIVVYAMNGAVVKSEKLLSASGSTHIGELPDGIYLFTVQMGDQILTRKFAKV